MALTDYKTALVTGASNGIGEALSWLCRNVEFKSMPPPGAKKS